MRKLSFRSFWETFKQLQGTPVSLARGTAVGVFVGFAPLLPLKSIIILAITLAARSSTVAAVMVCTLICNPLTYIPLYYLAWVVGNLLLPGRIDWGSLLATVQQMRGLGLVDALKLAAQMGFDAGMVLLVGGSVLALPFALLSYPLALRFFRRLERIRAEKHLLNAVDRQAPL